MPQKASSTRPLSAPDLKPFTDFDAFAEAEAGRAAPADFADSIGRLARVINKLPQRPAIKDDDARKWLENTMRMAVKRMMLEHGEDGFGVAEVHNHVLWHIRRASGIGGSDAATVLKHYRGQRGTFGDANELVKQKLLILAPQPSNDVMARGVRAEPWIQKICHANFATRTDEASLAKLRGFRPSILPAAVGTPDDITLPISSDLSDDEERSIDDYKAPSADVCEDYDANGVSFDYVCQLHHYGFISKEADIAFDKMAIKALDPRSFTIAVYPVAYDPQLSEELNIAIDRIWNEHVMLGVVPDAPRPDELPVEDEALINMAAEAAMMKIFMDDAKARHDDLRKRISEVSGIWHDLATGNMDLKIGAFSRRRSWKEEELLNLADRAGIETEEFYKVNPKKIDSAAALKIFQKLVTAAEKDGDVDRIVDEMIKNPPFEKKLDCDKLAEHLEDQDISLISAMDVSESLRLSTKKKGPEADRLSMAREHVSMLMAAIEGSMADAVQSVLTADQEQPEADHDADYEMS